MGSFSNIELPQIFALSVANKLCAELSISSFKNPKKPEWIRLVSAVTVLCIDESIHIAQIGNSVVRSIPVDVIQLM